MRFVVPAALALATIAAPAAIAQTQPGAPVASRVVAGTYAVDTAHTQVTWSVNHMGFRCSRGSSARRVAR